MIKKYLEFILELKKDDLKGSYLLNDYENNLELENKLKTIIDDKIVLNQIQIPEKVGDKNFIKIKDFLKNDKDLLNIFTNNNKEPLNKEGLKKWIEKFIKNKYLNISPIKKDKKEFDIDFKKVDKSSPMYKQTGELNRGYGDNFEIYQILFTKEINDLIEKNPEFNKADKYMYLTLETDHLNRVHFPGRQVRNWYSWQLSGIPTTLRGDGISFFIYRAFIHKVGYLTSSTSSSSSIRKIWEKIIVDNSVNSIICNHDIIVFSKNYTGDIDNIVKKFLNSKTCTKNKLKIDTELENKLGDWYKEWKRKLVDSSYYLNNLNKLINKYKNYKITDEDIKDTKSKKLIFIVYLPKNKQIGVLNEISTKEDKSLFYSIQYLDSGKYYNDEFNEIDETSFNILEKKKINL
jgi:hypothetical protein